MKVHLRSLGLCKPALCLIGFVTFGGFRAASKSRHLCYVGFQSDINLPAIRRGDWTVAKGAWKGMGEGSWPPAPHGRTGALASSAAPQLGKEGVKGGVVVNLAATRETGACPQTSAPSLLLGTERQPGCGCAPASPRHLLWLPPLPLGSVP